MGPKASAFLLLFLLPFFLATAPSSGEAIDIETAFKDAPRLAGFAKLITQANLVPNINEQSTVTILGVNDDGLGPASGLAPDVLQKVLAVHVVLDYYDQDKFNQMQANEAVTLATLFQTSGNADKRQGFINMTMIDNGIKLGSAMPGSPHDVELLDIPVTKPYYLALLEVDKMIIPPGIDKSNGNIAGSTPQSSPTKTPVAAPTTPPAVAPPKAETPPAVAPPKAETPPAVAPPKADTPPAQTPKVPQAPAADTPKADAPKANTPDAKAPAPKAVSPVAPAPEADTPSADSPVADVPAPVAEKPADETASGAGQLAVGAAAGMVAMAGFLLGL